MYAYESNFFKIIKNCIYCNVFLTTLLKYIYVDVIQDARSKIDLALIYRMITENSVRLKWIQQSEIWSDVLKELRVSENESVNKQNRMLVIIIDCCTINSVNVYIFVVYV